MSKLALGLIETIGLATAIEAADAAVKSANVKLIGYELTKGDGMVTVKVEGDVGSVKAAMDAARAAALKIGQVQSVLVIPRPAENLDKIVFSKETVGWEQPEKKTKIVEADVLPSVVPVEEPPVEEILVEEAPVEEATVEETAIEEFFAEETPTEEAPVEESSVEEPSQTHTNAKKKKRPDK